jgi:DNA modification methylase
LDRQHETADTSMARRGAPAPAGRIRSGGAVGEPMIDLRLGDCLEIMATLPDASVDAVICDPPYGTTACKWDSPIPFAPMWEQLKRLIKPRGAIVLFGSQPFTSALVMSNPTWFRYEWVWEKQQPTGHLDARRKPLKAHESILLFADGRVLYNPQGTQPAYIKNGRESKNGKGVYGNVGNPDYVTFEQNFPRSVLRVPCLTRGQEHPTQKPVALMSYLVKTYTNEGDTVLDFTFGSCTTGVACIETGRSFIGIENDPEYFRIGQERTEKAAAALHQLELAV